MAIEIKKVAIANRGEVAVRIIQACQELGYATCLLHSPVDRKTRAYRLADETLCIGTNDMHDSYLSIDNNIEGLKACGADAVHPGFGFLSENADFAQAVGDIGCCFIGPSPEAIRIMGDKIQAKKLIEQSGVATIPGYAGEDQSLPTLSAKAKEIGFPVIVKAAAGGGGRGMKIISSEKEAQGQIESAQREAKSAFGSEKVFLEKYLDQAKHIEVQVFGDSAGQAVHLFERECTIQRRHQKIVEEAVSGSLSSSLRQQLCKAAVELAVAANYTGAGTVEFLVQDGKFYFLEMNTRLQVEHSVTELVLGIDLVKAQIQMANGRMALWPQDILIPRGHSIECRIYAEDPTTKGIPSTGKLGFQHWPEGPGRRFDYGFESGDTITSFYDSMIAKVIVWDETRDRAIMKMQRVLSESIVFGVKTNIPMLQQILCHEEYISGTMTTQFIQNHFPDGIEDEPMSQTEAAFMDELSKYGPSVLDSGDNHQPSPFSSSWRMS